MSDSDDTTERTKSPDRVSVTLKRRLWGRNGLNKRRNVSETLEGRTPIESGSDFTDEVVGTVNSDIFVIPERPEQVKAEQNRRTEEFVEEKVIKKEKKAKGNQKHYAVMFAKPSARKHKKWEDDGVLIATGRGIVLKDSEGNVLAQGQKDLNKEMIEDGKPFLFGGKEVKIVEELSDMGQTPADSDSDLTYEVVEEAGTVNSDNFVIPERLEQVKTKKKQRTEEFVEEKVIKKEKKAKGNQKHYAVMFGKPSAKKHKTWEDDGFIIATGKGIVLKDSEGNVLAQGQKDLNKEMIEDGKPFLFGGKEVKIVEELSDMGQTPADSDSDLTDEAAQEAGTLNPDSEIFVIPEIPKKVEDKQRTEEFVEDKMIKKEKKVKAVERYFGAMFGKPSAKKHKTWEDDGFIIATGREIVLKDCEGNILASGRKDLNEDMIEDGKPFLLGSKEVKIVEELSEKPYGI